MSADPEATQPRATPSGRTRWLDVATDVRLEYFQLAGAVDDRPVSAVFENGRLVVDEPLWERADLLVALGEVFDRDDGAMPVSVAATLDGSLVAVLVTLIRACDRVMRSEFAFRH